MMSGDSGDASTTRQPGPETDEDFTHILSLWKRRRLAPILFTERVQKPQRSQRRFPETSPARRNSVDAVTSPVAGPGSPTARITSVSKIGRASCRERVCQYV